MIPFWKSLLNELKGGKKVFLTLVAQNTPHSPGTAGAKMFLPEEGRAVGTVGGGVMEHRLIEMAKEAFQQETFEPKIETLAHRKIGTGMGERKSGMVCAGEQINLYYLCLPDRDKEPIQKALALMEGDRSGSLFIGEKGEMEMREKEPLFRESPYRITREEGKWIYEEELLNRKRMAIIGGGHCSFALSRTMKNLGYIITVFDIRKDLSTFGENIWARHKYLIENYTEAGKTISYPELTPVVVMTADQPSDVRAMAGLLNLPFPYIGVMGSGAKIHQIYKDLEDLGWSDVRSREDLYIPVGLPINSHTPAEIAISVAAQLLQERERLFPFFGTTKKIQI